MMEDEPLPEPYAEDAQSTPLELANKLVPVPPLYPFSVNVFIIDRSTSPFVIFLSSLISYPEFRLAKYAADRFFVF